MIPKVRKIKLKHSRKPEDSIETCMKRFCKMVRQQQLQQYPHQFEGVHWCLLKELGISNTAANCRGGFIADEMGLGKTITVIGVMVANPKKHTLIVVPRSLTRQWADKVEQLTNITPLMYSPRIHSISDIKSHKVVIASYSAIISKFAKLHEITWNRTVYDEAHYLRNDHTKRYRCCLRIRRQIQWLVTGTPMQNRIKDLHNLCCMAGIPETFYKNNANLKVIGKHILRRTKEQVGILLPPVTKVNVVTKWKDQCEIHLSKEIHSMVRNQAFLRSKQSLERKSYHKTIPNHLVAFIRAKQCCVMPKLIEQHMMTLIQQGALDEEWKDSTQSQSKLTRVIRTLLEHRNNGTGKIVFCNFRQEIDYLYANLTAQGMHVVYYDGRNSNQDLTQQCEVLIMQIQCGCDGLNLQEHFSEVYFVSPHWNPQVEEQAIARCHRIGQQRAVKVFRFIMKRFKPHLVENEVVEPVTMDMYICDTQLRKIDETNKIFKNMELL